MLILQRAKIVNSSRAEQNVCKKKVSQSTVYLASFPVDVYVDLSSNVQ